MPPATRAAKEAERIEKIKIFHERRVEIAERTEAGLRALAAAGNVVALECCEVSDSMHGLPTVAVALELVSSLGACSPPTEYNHMLDPQSGEGILLRDVKSHTHR